MPETRVASVLSESLQDYLEVVYWLVQQNRVARITEIAAMLNVGKPSATGAIQALAEKGLVHYDPYRFITLTEKGQAQGRYLVRRHGVLKRFLMEVLGVPEAEAERVGCKMEHAVKGDVLDRFVGFMDFVEVRSAAGGSWAEAFRRFRRTRVSKGRS
jgi:DtxR family transcriptional regulator, Mn-dependent transcriptional regulator